MDRQEPADGLSVSRLFPSKLFLEAVDDAILVRTEDGEEHFSIMKRACGGYDPCSVGLALVSNLGQRTSWAESTASEQLMEFIQRYNAMDGDQRKRLLTEALRHADEIGACVSDPKG